MVNYTSLTEEDIKKLAGDIYLGLVFTDRHIENPSDIPRVFVPLMLMGEEQIEELRSNPPGMIYEYIENASPMGIDGMPIFFSFRLLDQEDVKKVNKKYIQIKEAVEKV